MFQTCEIRWFFSSVPLEVDKHFEDDTELQVRTDWYAIPCDRRCGIKVREGRLETKMLHQSFGRRSFQEFSGHLEAWRKWSLEFPSDDLPKLDDLQAAGWLEVSKRRYLQRFAVENRRVKLVPERPDNGCEFEMTVIEVAGRTWWTVGFEAVGPPNRQELNLEQVALFVTRRGGLKCPFVATCSFGYAHWLGQFVKHD